MQNELMGKANEILGLLAEDKNVLLTGAPPLAKRLCSTWSNAFLHSAGRPSLTLTAPWHFHRLRHQAPTPFPAAAARTVRYSGRHFTKEQNTATLFEG